MSFATRRPRPRAPTPRALIRLLPPIASRRDEILAALRDDQPRVELLPEGDDTSTWRRKR